MYYILVFGDILKLVTITTLSLRYIRCPLCWCVVDKIPIRTEAFLFVVEEYIDEAEFFHICLVHLNISYKRVTFAPLLLPLPQLPKIIFWHVPRNIIQTYPCCILLINWSCQLYTAEIYGNTLGNWSKLLYIYSNDNTDKQETTENRNCWFKPVYTFVFCLYVFGWSTGYIITKVLFVSLKVIPSF